MKTLQINGKTYKKAGDLARELGYTTDYMGQLCREEKVIAELVGRTWYVEPTSVHEHKSTRYRSSKSVTSKTIKDTVAKRSFNPKDTPREVHLHPVSYEGDEMELIPLQKSSKQRAPVHISVQEARENRIKIQTTSETTHLQAETEVLEGPKNKGYLSIVAIEDVQTDIDPVDFTQAVRNSPKEPSPVEKSPIHSSNVKPRRAENVTEPKIIAVEETYTLRYTILSTLASLLLAVVVSLAFVSLETATEVTSSGTNSTVRINIEKTANVIFSALK